MSLYDFDRIIDRRNTSSFKWDKYRGTDILPMWVADMDFQSPPAVLAALHERVDHGVFGYTLPPTKLVETVVDMLARDYQWQIKPSWIVWLPGLVCGINVACRTLGNTGDGILTTTPIYPPFLTAPDESNRTLITAPLKGNDHNWQMDFDALDKAVTSDTKMLLFCSPHNPTGRVYSRRELEDVAAFVKQHDLVLCSDEIHCGLILDKGKNHIPTATLDAETATRTITLMAPSKTYNIPGLGASFAIISDPQLRKQFQRAMAGIVPHVNVLAFTAALAAYKDSTDWHDALLDYLRENRDLLEQRIEKIPGLSMGHVEATYLAWIDTRGLELENPSRFFEAAGVGLSDGREFGDPGFVRLNFGCSRDQLNLALERMESAIQQR